MSMTFERLPPTNEEPGIADIVADHIASRYLAAGMSVIPLKLDGSKSPSLACWNPYRKRFMIPPQVLQLFVQCRRGIGIVCGIISGGLEALDFDNRPDETFSAWRQSIPTDLFSQLGVIETAGGGYHVLYRSGEVCGNTKIAMTRGKEVLIETRGEGGYIVGVGSPAEVHPSGRPYVQLSGPPLPEVMTISTDERRLLWMAAAKLDERSAEEVRREYVDRRTKELKRAAGELAVDTSTPWGAFDAEGNWPAILEPHGWHSHDGVNWARPGKSSGVSAKVNVNEEGVAILTVFSTEAGPLAPKTGAQANYGPFNAYKALNHGGDPKAAARELRAKGYGGTKR